MPKLSALQIAELINRQVQYDLPIGATNIRPVNGRMSSYERTGFWSNVMVEGARGKEITYYKNDQGSWRESYFQPVPYNLSFFHPAEANQSECYFFMSLSNTLLHKAGNCGEMALLALLRFAEYATLNMTEADEFMVQHINMDGIDHSFLILTLNGERVIIDPWMQFAEVITEENTAKFIYELCQLASEENLNAIRQNIEHFFYNIINGTFTAQLSNPFNKIDNLHEARRFVSLHKSLHDTCLHYWSWYKRFTTGSYDGTLAEPHLKNQAVNQELKERESNANKNKMRS